MLKRLLRWGGVQRVVAALLAAWLVFVHRSARWQVALDPDAAALLVGGKPFILAVWHERLPAIVSHWKYMPDPRCRPAATLHFIISGHRDGRLIAAVAARLGIASVEGSTSRGGAAALARMLALLGGGAAVVGITPDGPRGPRRVAQPGVAALARLSGRPVVCAAAATAHHRRARSWDRMMIPLPFGAGALVAGPPIRIDREADQSAALATIAAALDEACARADAMVGLAAG